MNLNNNEIHHLNGSEHHKVWVITRDHKKSLNPGPVVVTCLIPIKNCSHSWKISSLCPAFFWVIAVEGHLGTESSASYFQGMWLENSPPPPTPTQVCGLNFGGQIRPSYHYSKKEWDKIVKNPHRSGASGDFQGNTYSLTPLCTFIIPSL